MLLVIIAKGEAVGFLGRRGFSEDKGGLIWWWRVRGAAITPCLFVIFDYKYRKFSFLVKFRELFAIKTAGVLLHSPSMLPVLM